MARVKGIAISNLEGRLGNVVFRNRQGVNVASQRPASVKNPRTESQQKQRMLFNTAVQAYSVLKNVADHSFEGVPAGAKSQAEFLKHNIAMLGTSSFENPRAFVMRHNKAYAPNAYLISRGSLPTIPVGYNVIPSGDLQPFNFRLKPYVVYPGTNSDPGSLSDFMEMYGLRVGDQLSFVAVFADNSIDLGVGQKVQASNTFAAEVRFTIKLDADLSLPLFTSGGPNSAVITDYVSSSILEPNLNYDSQISSLGIFLDFDFNKYSMLGAAVILSRKDGNKWLRSTQSLVGNSECILDTQSDGYILEDVIRTYNPSDPLFLNNAR